MKSVNKIAFEFFADTEQINGICSDVNNWLVGLELQSVSFYIEMVLREALNNAVLHGCGNNPELKVKAELHNRVSNIMIKVEDEGPGFDWKSQIKKDIDDEDCHGRGIKIYQIYADRVLFNHQGNKVILCVKIYGGNI